MIRPKSIAGAAAIAVGLAAGPAASADRAGDYAVKGFGQARCAEFNAAVADRSPQLQGMLGWLAGYLTAANRYEPQTYDIVAWQNELYLVGSVQSYCTKNPGTPLAGVAEQMVRTLRPRRITLSSPMQTIVAGGRSIQIYGEIVQRAKAALAQRRLYTGHLDPAPSPSFTKAIAAFQRNRKLPATGLPDQQTLFLLFQPAAVRR